MSLETLHLIRLVAHIAIGILGALLLAWIIYNLLPSTRKRRKLKKYQMKREIVKMNNRGRFL